MNDCQRRQIEAMRKQGMGYKAIARKTKLTGQRTELLQVAPPRRLRQSGGGCLQRGASV